MKNSTPHHVTRIWTEFKSVSIGKRANHHASKAWIRKRKNEVQLKCRHGRFASRYCPPWEFRNLRKMEIFSFSDHLATWTKQCLRSRTRSLGFNAVLYAPYNLLVWKIQLFRLHDVHHQNAKSRLVFKFPRKVWDLNLPSKNSRLHHVTNATRHSRKTIESQLQSITEDNKVKCLAEQVIVTWKSWTKFVDWSFLHARNF